MARSLTVPMIEKLKADPAKRVEVSDGLLPALRVVVQPSGAKSYAVRYRHRGRPAKLTIGPVGVVSLAEARDAAGWRWPKRLAALTRRRRRRLPETQIGTPRDLSRTSLRTLSSDTSAN